LPPSQVKLTIRYGLFYPYLRNGKGGGGGADYLLTYAQRKSLPTFAPQGSRYFNFLIL
jgi:hypothetical protein